MNAQSKYVLTGLRHKGQVKMKFFSDKTNSL